MDRNRTITANFSLPSSGPSGWIKFNGPEDAATPQIFSSNYAPSAPGSFRISWSTPYASSSSTTNVTSDNSAVTPLSSTRRQGSKDFSGIPVGTYTFTNTNTAPSTASNTLEWGDTGGALFRVKRNGTVVATSGSSMSIGPSDTSKFGTYTLEVQNNAGEYEEVSSTTVDASSFSAESTKSASCTVVVGDDSRPVVTIEANPASGTAPVSATVHYTVANATEYTYTWSGPTGVSFTPGSTKVTASSVNAAPEPYGLSTAGTYTFTITAKNASSGKSATASATVTVSPGPSPKPTATITATPNVIYQGESFVLTLKTEDTKSWAFTAPSGGGANSMSGVAELTMDMTVTPSSVGTYTYKISGVGDSSTDGSTATDSVTVTVMSSGRIIYRAISFDSTLVGRSYFYSSTGQVIGYGTANWTGILVGNGLSSTSTASISTSLNLFIQNEKTIIARANSLEELYPLAYAALGLSYTAPVPFFNDMWGEAPATTGGWSVTTGDDGYAYWAVVDGPSGGWCDTSIVFDHWKAEEELLASDLSYWGTPQHLTLPSGASGTLTMTAATTYRVEAIYKLVRNTSRFPGQINPDGGTYNWPVIQATVEDGSISFTGRGYRSPVLIR